MAGGRRDSAIGITLGYVAGPTLWALYFSIMAYGLWVRAWYGTMMAALLATFAAALFVFLYRAQRMSDAEIEQIARDTFDESDQPPSLED